VYSPRGPRPRRLQQPPRNHHPPGRDHPVALR
jgi:hypothetical protein